MNSSTTRNRRQTYEFYDARRRLGELWRQARQARSTQLGGKRRGTVEQEDRWLEVRGMYAAAGAVCRDRDIPMQIATAATGVAIRTLSAFVAENRRSAMRAV